MRRSRLWQRPASLLAYQLNLNPSLRFCQALSQKVRPVVELPERGAAAGKHPFACGSASNLGWGSGVHSRTCHGDRKRVKPLAPSWLLDKGTIPPYDSYYCHIRTKGKISCCEEGTGEPPPRGWMASSAVSARLSCLPARNGCAVVAAGERQASGDSVSRQPRGMHR